MERNTLNNGLEIKLTNLLNRNSLAIGYFGLLSCVRAGWEGGVCNFKVQTSVINKKYSSFFTLTKKADT